MKVLMWLKSIRTATIDTEGNSCHTYIDTSILHRLLSWIWTVEEVRSDR
jgi:hypothetical protein